MRSDGVESMYWADTELLGGYGVGSNGRLQLPWGHLRHRRFERQHGNGSFYRHDIKGGGCYKVGEGTGGGSFGRAEFAAACPALEDFFTHDQPFAVLTDSEKFMTVSLNWVGEGKDLLLRHFKMGTYSLASSRFFTKG